MTLDPALLRETLELTARYHAIPRSAVEEDCLMDAFVAELESLEGYDTRPAEVLDVARDLALSEFAA